MTQIIFEISMKSGLITLLIILFRKELAFFVRQLTLENIIEFLKSPLISITIIHVILNAFILGVFRAP